MVPYWYLPSKTILSVLNKEPNTRWKSSTTGSWKLCSRGSKINHPESSPHKVLQSRLISTVYHLLVKNNKEEGRGLERAGLINFLPQKRGRLLERRRLFERRWPNRGFTVISRFYETVIFRRVLFLRFQWGNISLRSRPLPTVPLCLSREEFFPLSPRPLLKKKKKTRDSDAIVMVGYLTLYLGQGAFSVFKTYRV